MRILYSLLVLLLFVGRVAAVPIEGSCTEYELKTHPDDPTKVNETLALRVLRHEAPIYPSPSGGDPSSNRRFGEVVEPVTLSADPADGRIQVKRPTDADPLGWMDRADLLCRDRPLIKNYIERKAFIRTATGPNDSSAPVQSFPGPDLDDCPDPAGTDGCYTLRRFELLFVFARDPDTKRLLLAYEYRLKEDDILVGWVPEEQTVPWNTRLGLRPADHVEETLMYPDARSAATTDNSGAYPVKGNRDGRWYTYPHHIPLLDQENVQGRAVYKVAAPGPKVRIDEDPYLPNQGTGSIAALKGVDVFFLIDGTRSITPHIRAVEEVVSTLAEELTEDKEGGHRGNHYRFGFRIFRDHYADADSSLSCQKGMCEKLLIDRDDCGQDSRTMDESRDRFLDAIRGVNASWDDGDDYPELLFAGIEQAIQDVGGCDERSKLLIIIGNHGDRLSEVPDRLQTQIRDFASDLLIFFIQTPAELNTTDYQNAYVKFKADARAILRLVYPDDKFQGRDMSAEREAALLSLSNTTQTEAKIKQILASYTNSRAVNEIMTAIRGGEALDDFLRVRMAKDDLPILFWGRAYRKLCAENDHKLGRQCTEPVDHVVDYAYVPVSDDWTEEVWLSSANLHFWLNTLKDLADGGGQSATEERAAFIRALVSILETKIGKPLKTQTRESIEEFMRRKSGLPVRAHSPLLQYEISELRRIEPCELRRLRRWAGSIYDLLNGIKASPRLKPSFTLEDYTSRCTGITDKGRKLPKMRMAPLSGWARLGKDERATFEHEIAGGLIRYWLPQKYLP